MLSCILLPALLIFAAAASPRIPSRVAQLDGRIFGGEQSIIVRVPYQLSLARSGKHICGASILSKTRALTAAHCTPNGGHSHLTVRAGTTFHEDRGQVVPVIKVINHMWYTPESYDYDVSVLVLQFEIVLGNFARHVELPPIDTEQDVGSLATVSGWGQTGYSKPLAEHVFEVDVPKLSDGNCRLAHPGITSRMVCYGYMDKEGTKGPGQGDDGGPLVENGVQYGIVSWGWRYGLVTSPAVYTNIADKEIHKHITDNS